MTDTEIGYILDVAEKSTCPICHTTVDMLADYEMKEDKPGFYICWECRSVFQIGVGQIKRYDTEGESE